LYSGHTLLQDSSLNSLPTLDELFLTGQQRYNGNHSISKDNNEIILNPLMEFITRSSPF
jgi:hypothetical protein